MLEAKHIIEHAAEEAKAIIKSAKEEADMQYKETIAKAEKEALEDFNDIVSYAHWECHMLLKRALQELDEAAAMIVRNVMD
jgi:vacuolar-type H+-ATPase subunit H